MNPNILSVMRCPVCRAPLSQSADGKVFRCLGERFHCFDAAKSGYVNLAGPSPKSGDAKDAIRARTLFLGAGYYQPLCDEIDGLLSSAGVCTFLDAGCGEGYYTNRLALSRDALGVDLSRDGIDNAAKTAKREGTRASFAVASLFSVPAADASFDAVINLFAPCAEPEFCRVLKSGGVLLLVGAGERHLFGLKQAIYDDPYLNPGRDDLPKEMRLAERKNLRYTIRVEGQEQIQALFSMTPYYWRTSPTDRQKLSALDSLSTEVDFDIFLFRKD